MMEATWAAFVSTLKGICIFCKCIQFDFLHLFIENYACQEKKSYTRDEMEYLWRREENGASLPQNPDPLRTENPGQLRPIEKHLLPLPSKDPYNRAGKAPHRWVG
jgi:hypothetical protein